MKLVSGGTTVDKCPYLSPEARKEIEEALAPPMKLVTIGSGDNVLQIGNEEVIFRHENTFIHQPGFALLISDKEDDATVDAKIRKISELTFPWVGLTLKADLLALRFESGDKYRFEALVRKVCEKTRAGIILISEDMEALFPARDICAERNPLIYPVTRENIDEAIPRIKSKPTPVGVRAASMEEISVLTSKLKDAQVEDIVLDPGSKNMLEIIRDQTLIRRAALKQNFRPLGYPTLAFPCSMTDNKLQEILLASMLVTKYAGIIVLSDPDPVSLLPLLIHRLNIYTNPQSPISVEEKIYEIGNPDENSPVIVASSWALTYLLLESAIEETGIPAFLCVKHIEEADVMCWCPHCLRSAQLGNLNINETRQFILNCGIDKKVRHRKLVIPGRAARFRPDILQALPDWEIIVGPEKAPQIKTFLPEFVKN